MTALPPTIGKIMIGIDPGPDHCGFVLYDWTHRKVLDSDQAKPIDEVLRLITPSQWYGYPEVAIERFQSGGKVLSADSIRTIENVGKLWQKTLDGSMTAYPLYRREVLKILDVSGEGTRDAMIRQRLIEMFGGSRATAVGTAKKPGPLFGVVGHSWQALAVAVAAVERYHG